ncbi:hypothetical protein [Thermoflexibacter ruber]|uniref:Peptidase C39-like domain-containing protein n=1 Tax=Thermoflexibacter ruber TaxID=1003 RepID=A0A1I2K888_9BACT|nr:hypothetical protein [Thermoflexibacter ruber]SFF61417.1 hypothetical protein SAMN04488541_10834 [Thermoflexibacter ruber]
MHRSITGRDVTETAWGTSYTGVDAQRAFMQLKLMSAYNKKQQEQEKHRARMIENWKTIEPIITKENWVGKGHGRTSNDNCYEAADKQMQADPNAKARIKGAYDYTEVYNESWESKGKTLSNTMLIVATNYITVNLQENKPVKVGLNYELGHPGNKDKTTDHWVVIVGQGKDEHGVYFNYYDNYDKDINRGTNGRLYLHNDNTYRTIKGRENATMIEAVYLNVILTTILHNEE